jgi:hypothetical protein
MSNGECRVQDSEFRIRHSTSNIPPADLVSWVLLLMALGTFTPCVLLPEWRAYQVLQMAEQAERHRVGQMRHVVGRERRLVEALQTDPAVIRRVAQRELGFKMPGDRAVLVSVSPEADSTDALGASFVPQLVPPPPVLARAASYLPDYPYDRVFCDERTRLIVMGMSVALMLVAVCLHTRRPLPRHQNVE